MSVPACGPMSDSAALNTWIQHPAAAARIRSLAGILEPLNKQIASLHSTEAYQNLVNTASGLLDPRFPRVTQGGTGRGLTRVIERLRQRSPRNDAAAEWAEDIAAYGTSGKHVSQFTSPLDPFLRACVYLMDSGQSDLALVTFQLQSFYDRHDLWLDLYLGLVGVGMAKNWVPKAGLDATQALIKNFSTTGEEECGRILTRLNYSVRTQCMAHNVRAVVRSLPQDVEVMIVIGHVHMPCLIRNLQARSLELL